MIQTIKSRIHEFLPRRLQEDLYRICKNTVISDNNLKVPLILDTLKSYDVDFVELGPGTNRLAVLIDNYVFKIALDKWGLQDNLNEFTMSQELQPYVVKTYETNELISVCEYVTVISRDEFTENKDTIRSVLSVLADSFLLGDVGSVPKNFTNWGYRDNEELVILDFAYIYRVQGSELLCSLDQTILEYDENFYNLKCPTCRKVYSFMDVRRKIPMAQEKHENEVAKQFSFKLTKPVQQFSDGYQDSDVDVDASDSSYNSNTATHTKEELTMKRENNQFENMTPEEEQESYLQTMELLKSRKGQLNSTPVTPEESTNDFIISEPTRANENTEMDTKIIEFDHETPTEKSHIKIYSQTKAGVEKGDDSDIIDLSPVDDMKKTIEDLNEGVKAVKDAEPDVDNVTRSITSPDGNVTISIEDNHVVGPVNDEVLHDIADNQLNEFLDTKPEDETDEQSDSYDEDQEGEYQEPSEDPMDDIMSRNEDEVLTTAILRDVDGDGTPELVVDPDHIYKLITPTKNQQTETTDAEYYDMDAAEQNFHNLMENDSDEESDVEVHQGEIVKPETETEEIVYKHNVKVTDHISVENTLKVKVTETDEDKLRRELLEDTGHEGEIADVDTVKKLAEDYSHLEDQTERDYEDEFMRRKANNKDWR